MKNLMLCLMMAGLVACGQSVEGVYKGDIASYKFYPDGTVTLRSMEVELQYEVEGDEVKIISQVSPPIIFHILDDGSLSGMGQKFVKVDG